MDSLAPLVGLLLMAASRSPKMTPSAAAPAPEGPLILFLIDNSASLPPLDPDEKRVVALERMFTFLKGQRYRLILFGGRHEIFADDVTKYRNNGQWTDFYFAFAKAREVLREYPPATDFRIILLTDALLDPSAQDWEDMEVPKGADLKTFVATKLLGLSGEMKTPLYGILGGEGGKGGAAPGAGGPAPPLVMEMVRAANGVKAAPMAQSLASFFGDDGGLFDKFVFRVAPHEGLAKI